MNEYLNCKFIRLYHTLSEADKVQLTKWFRYEFGGDSFQQATKLWQLYSLIIKPVEKKEAIWKKLYGKEAYNNRRLNNLLNKLCEKLEEFILFQEFQKSKADKSLIMANYLFRHNLSADCESEIRKAESLIREIPQKNTAYFRKMSGYGEILQKFSIVYESDLKRNYANIIFNNYEIAIAIEYLQYLCTAISNRYESTGVFEEANREVFIERLKNIPNISENAVIMLYLELYQLLVQKNISWDEILEIRTKLEANLLLLDIKEAIDIFRMLLNLSMKLLREGYSQQSFRCNWDMYVWGLEKNLLPIHGKIPVTNLRNMMIIGIKAHSFEYINHFMEENKILSDEKTDAIYALKYFSLFEKKDYAEILRYYSTEHYAFRSLYFEFDVLSYYFRACYMQNIRTSLKSKCLYRIHQIKEWEKLKVNPETYKFRTEFTMIYDLLKKDRETLLNWKKVLETQTGLGIQWWRDEVNKLLETEG